MSHEVESRERERERDRDREGRSENNFSHIYRQFPVSCYSFILFHCSIITDDQRHSNKPSMSSVRENTSFLPHRGE